MVEDYKDFKEECMEPTIRDYDQMLKAALEMKMMAQKFIDFAKLQGAGEGEEGEEDLVPPGEDEEMEDEEMEDEEKAPKSMNKGKNLAIILALRKRMKK